MTATGTKFPSWFSYASKLTRYKPFSMPTLQTRASAAPRAAADVPGPNAIIAAKHTNAQPTANELIMIFVNFVFIVVSFCLSFLVLAFLDSSLLSCHFWPFTDVLRRICLFVTRKMQRSVCDNAAMAAARTRAILRCRRDACDYRITSGRERRRFLRTVDHRAADPTTASVL